MDIYWINGKFCIVLIQLSTSISGHFSLHLFVFFSHTELIQSQGIYGNMLYLPLRFRHDPFICAKDTGYNPTWCKTWGHGKLWTLQINTLLDIHVRYCQQKSNGILKNLLYHWDGMDNTGLSKKIPFLIQLIESIHLVLSYH